MTLNEVAPPTKKHERMVKHIKKNYKKDGKLTDDEKSIAYATAWKNYNKKESFEIDKSAHKAASKKAKMRNLAKGNTNPNEKAAAEKKAGGPKLYGEEVSRRKKPSAIKKRKTLDAVMNKYDDLKKKIGSKEKHMEPVTEATYQEMIDAGWEMSGEGIWWPPQSEPETVTEKLSFSMFKKKAVERKPEKAQDAGSRAKRKLARKAHAKYVSGSEDNVPDDIRDHYEVSEGSLHKWFSGSKSKDGKPGWVQSDGSPCANEPGETKTPKCYSSAKKASMSKKELRSADARKSRQDPNQQQKSGAAKPTYVATDKKKKVNEDKVLKTVAKELDGASKMHKGQSEKIKKHLKGMKKVDECWKTHKKVGMKKKGGKMVPDCRPKNEEVVTEADKKGKGSGTKDACYHKVKARFKVWPSAYGSGALVKCRKVGAANWGNSKKEEIEYAAYAIEAAAWTKKSGKNPEGGLNEKGRKSYERENPGSDLKAPQPEGGSRKKSFCARMGGMKKKLTSSKTANDPDSRINKALRKWKC